MGTLGLMGFKARPEGGTHITHLVRAAAERVVAHTTMLRDEEGRELSAIVMQTSWADELLKTLLKKYLLGSESKKNALFQFHGPLGTFSARIGMSVAVGLIAESLGKALDAMRDIRNAGAHLEHAPSEFLSKSKKAATGLRSLKGIYPDLDDPDDLSFVMIAGQVTLCTLALVTELQERLKADTSLSEPQGALTNHIMSIAIAKVMGEPLGNVLDHADGPSTLITFEPEQS